MNRRELIARGLAVAPGIAIATALERRTPSATRPQATAVDPPDSTPVTLVVNGRRHRVDVDPRASLLDAVRDQVGLTGAKKGCNQGACGACTMLLDGQRVLSCLTLAVMHDGAEVTTVEGLSRGGRLHPVQQAFMDHDGFQCGFCTSGQIVSAVGLLAERPDLQRGDIPELMSGNLCRCGAYCGIRDAIAAASGSKG